MTQTTQPTTTTTDVPAAPAAPVTKREEKPKGWRRAWYEMRPVVVMLVVLFSFRSAVADYNVVPTGSMKPMNRESSLLSRLSPIMKYCPGGTVSGP